jgi:hypothetical protein
MADLRRMALDKGYAHDKEAEFGQAFAETVQTHGRMYEPELMTRYYLRVLDIGSLLGMVPMGLKMILKGKLPFLPERVADPDEIADLGVAESTKLRVATGVSGPGSKGTKKAIGGAIGGALLALIAGLLVGWGREKTS